jgi:pyruvate dehydrogenase E1 component
VLDLAALAEIETRLHASARAAIEQSARDGAVGRASAAGQRGLTTAASSVAAVLWFDVLRAEDRVSVTPHAAPLLHAVHRLLEASRSAATVRTEPARSDAYHLGSGQHGAIQHDGIQIDGIQIDSGRTDIGRTDTGQIDIGWQNTAPAEATRAEVARADAARLASPGGGRPARGSGATLRATGAGTAGPSGTVWGALARRYAGARFDQAPGGRAICIISYPELRDSAVWEAVTDERTSYLGELFWIVLVAGAPVGAEVPGGDRSGLGGPARAARMFEAAGWQVLTLRYGRRLEALFRRPGGQALRARLDRMTPAEYHELLLTRGRELRRRLAGPGAAGAGISGLLDDLTDEEVLTALRDLGGHDLALLIDAFDDVAADRPTVLFAYTHDETTREDVTREGPIFAGRPEGAADGRLAGTVSSGPFDDADRFNDAGRFGDTGRLDGTSRFDDVGQDLGGRTIDGSDPDGDGDRGDRDRAANGTSAARGGPLGTDGWVTATAGGAGTLVPSVGASSPALRAGSRGARLAVHVASYLDQEPRVLPAPPQVPADSGRPWLGVTSTQDAFGGLLHDLAWLAPDAAGAVVTVSTRDADQVVARWLAPRPAPAPQPHPAGSNPVDPSPAGPRWSLSDRAAPGRASTSGWTAPDGPSTPVPAAPGGAGGHVGSGSPAPAPEARSGSRDPDVASDLGVAGDPGEARAAGGVGMAGGVGATGGAGDDGGTGDADGPAGPAGPGGRHVAGALSPGAFVGVLGNLGVAWNRLGLPLFPIGVTDEFAAGRVVPAWAAGCAADARSVLAVADTGVDAASAASSLAATTGLAGTTGTTGWEPAFAQDLAWCLLAALGGLGRPDGTSSLLRLSARPLDQRLAALPADEAGWRRRRAGVLAGGYRLRDGGPAPALTLVGMGAVLPEVLRAADELAAGLGRGIGVVVVTAPDLVFGALQARRGLADGPSWVLAEMFPAQLRGPLVTVVDGDPRLLAFLSGVHGDPISTLGSAAPPPGEPSAYPAPGDPPMRAGLARSAREHGPVDTATIVGAALDLLDEVAG